MGVLKGRWILVAAVAFFALQLGVGVNAALTKKYPAHTHGGCCSQAPTP